MTKIGLKPRQSDPWAHTLNHYVQQCVDKMKKEESAFGIIIKLLGKKQEGRRK